MYGEPTALSSHAVAELYGINSDGTIPFPVLFIVIQKLAEIQFHVWAEA
jgi:hypothetical protein